MSLHTTVRALFRRHRDRRLAHDPRLPALARAFVDGPWEADALAARGEAVLGGPDRWMRSFARRLVAHGPDREGLTIPALTHWLFRDPGVRRALLNRVDGASWAVPVRPRFHTPTALPTLLTRGDLAAWLGWSPSVLEGHVDRRHSHRHQAGFRDYVVRWRGERLIEAPKDRLKAAQLRILREILDRVPTHPAAHGFVRGRSPVTHARVHAGQAVVLRLDLRQFFANLTAPRVVGWFHALGFPWPVAVDLAGLTTTWTPRDVCARPPWNQPHLPQGAPTSPALANALAYTLDARLDGLCHAWGLQYSRYADDLTVSGPHITLGQEAAFGTVVRTEGFWLNRRKRLRMTASRAQRVTGLVVNAAPAVSRAERDRLRAVLHRVERHGWEAAAIDGVGDVRAWLLGRIAWVTQANAVHGAPLRERFDRLPAPP